MHFPSSNTPFLWIWKEDISVIRKRRQLSTVTGSVRADDTGGYSKGLICIDQVQKYLQYIGYNFSSLATAKLSQDSFNL